MSSASRFKDILLPKSATAFYTLVLGGVGFCLVLWVYADSYLSCKVMPGCVTPIAPGITGELLAAVVAMMGVHGFARAWDKRQDGYASGYSPGYADPGYGGYAPGYGPYQGEAAPDGYPPGSADPPPPAEGRP